MRPFSILSGSLAVALAVFSIGATGAFAADSSTAGSPQQSPTTQASPVPASAGSAGACVGKSIGTNCFYSKRNGKEITGICTTMDPAKALTCSPAKGVHNGGPASGQAHGQMSRVHPVQGQAPSSDSTQ